MRDSLRPGIFDNVAHLLEATDETLTLDNVKFLRQAIEIAWIIKWFANKPLTQRLDGIASMIEHVLDCVFSAHCPIVYVFSKKGTNNRVF